MAKKTSSIKGKDSKEKIQYFGTGKRKIVETKETVNGNLSQALNQTRNKERDGAHELLSLIFSGMEDDVVKDIKKIEKTLLEYPLGMEEIEALKDLLLKKGNIKKIPTFIKFFKNQGLSNSLSFEAVYELLRLNLTNEQLENLIIMADAGYQRDMEVNSILSEINDVEILSDSIVDKVVKIKEIKENYEDLGYEVDMNLDINDYILLKDIELSEQLIEKIQILIECKLWFSIKDLKMLENFEIDEPLVNKLKKLEYKVCIFFADLPTIKEMDINGDLLEKIDLLKELGLSLYGKDLLQIKELVKSDIEKLRYIEDKLGGKKFEYLDGLDFVSKLEISEIDKIIGDMKKLGLDKIRFFKLLYKIPDEVLQYCIENKITDYDDMKKVKAMYSISNKKSIKEYLNRKNEYLEKNRTLSEEKYKEYFGGKGKFGKHEINQGDLGLCYLYTGLEILKKMNGFAELIQSNLIEQDGCWMVRYPFIDGKWIKVNKDEIDREYEYEIRRHGPIHKVRKMNINSKSEYLGFKILEIAYIKNKLINKMGNEKLSLSGGDGEKDSPLDINITGEMLKDVEGGNTIETLQELFSEEKCVRGEISNKDYRMFEKFKSIKAPECVIKDSEKRVNEINNRKNVLFDLYPTGFISIKLSCRNSYTTLFNSIDLVSRDLSYSLGHGIEKMIDGKKVYFLVSNVKIVDKFGQEIPKEKLKNISDVVIDGGGKTRIKIVTNHAYSVEKCYVDENGEKKVRVVNPRHTGIKFDLSLDLCKLLFDWDFGVIDMEKLFK